MFKQLRVWDEKYHQWNTEPLMVYPNCDIVRQGHIISYSTGFTDINDVPIFEGDILKVVTTSVAKNMGEEAEWSNPVTLLHGMPMFNGRNLFAYICCKDRLKLTVVGNIYENNAYISDIQSNV